MNLKKYKNIILDFDGVIVDTNEIKKSAISKASCGFLPEKKHKEFVTYFIYNNGLPRELKINKFFDKEIAKKVLITYNTLLEKMLINVSFTDGFGKFLNLIKVNKLNAYIVSGGDKNEIKKILKQNNIEKEFNLILAAPRTKDENFKLLNLDFSKTVYIGDSLIDYKVAKNYNVDFIFMSRYSQFYNWKEYFKEEKNITIIKDFTTLINCKC